MVGYFDILHKREIVLANKYSLYPNGFDNSTSMPLATDGVTPVKAETVNRIIDAVQAIERELGLHPSGTFGSLKSRLDALDPASSGEGDDDNGGSPTGAAGGDLSGEYPDPVLAQISADAISAGTTEFTLTIPTGTFEIIADDVTLTTDTINITGDIVPSTDDSNSIGSSTNRLANLHSTQISIRDDITDTIKTILAADSLTATGGTPFSLDTDDVLNIGPTSATAINIGRSGVTPTLVGADVSGNITPTTDNTRSVGSSTKRFTNVHSTQITARADTTDTLKSALTSNALTGTGAAFTFDVNNTLNVGTASATAVNIGRTGVTTAIAGSVTAAGQKLMLLPSKLNINGVSGKQTTSNAVFTAVGAMVFDPSAYFAGNSQITRTIRFVAVLESSIGSATASIELYNLDTASYVANTLLTTVATSATTLTTSTLTVPTDFPNSAQTYEVHIKLTSGSVSDVATCKMARIEVTYT